MNNKIVEANESRQIISHWLPNPKVNKSNKKRGDSFGWLATCDRIFLKVIWRQVARGARPGRLHLKF